MLLVFFILSVFQTPPLWANSFRLDDLGNVVLREGAILGESAPVAGLESARPAPPLNTFVFSADEYRLKNEKGQLKIEAFDLKDASPAAEAFDLIGPSNLRISTQGKGFRLLDDPVIAQTDLPLVVKRAKRSVYLITSGGEREIKFGPAAVVQKLLAERFLNKIEILKREAVFPEPSGSASSPSLGLGLREETVVILEEGQKALYEVRGQRRVRLFNFWPLDLAATVRIDVESGEVKNLKLPFFLERLDFLYTSE